jgi:hypothetical protein
MLIPGRLRSAGDFDLRVLRAVSSVDASDLAGRPEMMRRIAPEAKSRETATASPKRCVVRDACAVLRLSPQRCPS